MAMPPVRILITALVMILAGVNHFWSPAFYVRIMPSWFPAKETLNILSALAEIIFGLALLYGPTRTLGAYGLAALMVSFLAVHISHLLHSPFAGPVWIYWARLALQPLLIWWFLGLRR